MTQSEDEAQSWELREHSGRDESARNFSSLEEAKAAASFRVRELLPHLQVHLLPWAREGDRYLSIVTSTLTFEIVPKASEEA